MACCVLGGNQGFGSKKVVFGLKKVILGKKGHFKSFSAIFGSKNVISGPKTSFYVVLGQFMPFSAISVTFPQKHPCTRSQVQGIKSKVNVFPCVSRACYYVTS